MQYKKYCRSEKRRRETLSCVAATLLIAFSASVMTPAHAGYLEQAQRLHDRLAGVPPTEEVLQEMADAIDPALPGNANTAATIAMDNKNFYNVTLKNFAAPWTNRDQSVFVPLNDYIATVIGMIRDGVPFNTLLSHNIIYVGRSGLVSAAPSASNNDHYEQLEENNIDLHDALEPASKAAIQGNPEPATAGVMTSLAAS